MTSCTPDCPPRRGRERVKRISTLLPKTRPTIALIPTQSRRWRARRRARIPQSWIRIRFPHMLRVRLALQTVPRHLKSLTLVRRRRAHVVTVRNLCRAAAPVRAFANRGFKKQAMSHPLPHPCNRTTCYTPKKRRNLLLASSFRADSYAILRNFRS